MTEQRHLRRALLLLSPALAFTLCADDWPQWLGPRRDSVWRETGIVERFPDDGPRVRWRAPIGAGYAGPAVAAGRVFVHDRKVAAGSKDPRDPFARGQIPGRERVLCLNETTGGVLWQREYDCPYTVSYAAGPRCTPTVSEGKVFTLGAEGNLCCYNATNGEVIWSRDFKKDYQAATPMWGFASHPLVDGDRVISLVGGPGSTVVAFDRNTGKEVWRGLTAKEPGYCPPTLIEAGGTRQLIIWHPEAVNSLNPQTGERYWTERFPVRHGLTIATPRQRGDRLFLTAFYEGSLMLRLAPDQPAATVAWRSTKASERDTDCLHAIMCTPFLEDNHLYGVCSYGQLRGLNAATGERLWETLAATTPNHKETRWANAFLVKHATRYFLFNEKGDLIIARLSPQGYYEISRAHLLEPTNTDPGRAVVWSHPAFANRSCYARNDREIVCVSLAGKE